MTLPRFTTHAALDDVAYLEDGQDSVQGKDVTLSSGQVSAITPTFRHPPGTVIAFRTSTGEYELADSANVDANSAPAKVSSGHADATDVISVVGNHGTISVTVTTGSGTEANCATDLNADASFAANYIATSGGGELTITALNTGSEEWFYMGAATAALYAFSEGEANSVAGTNVDVRVTTHWAELQDIDGTAIDALVPNLLQGNFDESELASLTAEAKANLIARGSRFS